MTKVPAPVPSTVPDEAAWAAGRAYDSLAHRYDTLIQENVVLAQAARLSLRIVSHALAERSFVLELGCGTGRETLEVAAMGKHVVACDPSHNALQLLKEKATASGLEDLITTREIPASGIATLLEEFGERSFDGAFSSFALSYERELTSVRDFCWRLLKPGSPFVCSIYNRICLMELLLLAPFLVPRRALTRLEGVTVLPVDQEHVRIRSYRPSEVVRIFSSQFSLKGIWAIPAVIPPNYLHRVVDLAGGFRSAWEDLDSRLYGRWPFKYLGSHSAFWLESIPSERKV